MHRRKARLFCYFDAPPLFLIFTLTLFLASPAFSARFYVKVDAAGANNGTSWTDSFTDLQDALGAAASGDEIWVAAGTYTPTTGTDPLISFDIGNGVRLYGGFGGTESSLNERDWTAHVTVLSGEIGTPDITDNSRHVVYSGFTDATTAIDGFTITRGFSDDGAGIWLEGSSLSLANLVVTNNDPIFGPGGWVGIFTAFSGSPTLDHVTVSANNGGGVRLLGGNVTSCIVTGNQSWGMGYYGNGTIEDSEFSYNGREGLSIHPGTVRNCVFMGNAESGAHVVGSADFEGCYFIGNTNSYAGAGLDLHGTATVVNCAFIDNSAPRGGALFLGNNTDVVLTNVSFFGNQTTLANGGAVYIDPSFSSADLYNVVIWGNEEPQVTIFSVGAATFYSSLVEGSGGSVAWDPTFGTDGGGNVDTDPMFMEPGGGNIRLLGNSPAIDAGDNTAPNMASTDMDGRPRIAGSAVDMGAYEFLCPTGSRIYVAAGATGNLSGSSWGDAYTTLRHALTALSCGGIDEIWVAGGTYTPSGDGDQSRTFELQSGLAIYGGFAGWETSLSERDFSTNTTILSGEIGSPDLEDNSFHVVAGSGTDASAVLDGFTITRGYAEGDFGGGMYSLLGSPTVRNVIFTDNTAWSGGGGAANLVGTAEFTNVVFYDNDALLGQGGAMYNSSSSPVMTNVTFFGNTSLSGGGAMHNLGGGTAMTNSVMWGNTGTTISNSGSSPVISHSLIEGSGGSASWNAAMGTDGGGNIDADPLFIDDVSGDLRIGSNSPAIDSGDNSAPNLLVTDVDGNPRVIGPTVDMGAYESLVATAIDDPAASPGQMALRSVFPNPFNPVVTIRFTIGRPQVVQIQVYDIRGKLVRTLVDEHRGLGHDEVQWEATNNRGQPVASGVYVVRMQAGSFSAQRKVVLLK